MIVLGLMWAKVWAWLKQNWRWVLFPVGILLLIAGWARKTTVVVQSPALEDADKRARELREQADKEVADAAVKRDHDIHEADTVVDVEAELQRAAQRDAAKAVQDDPDALNRVLIDTGKTQRETSR